MLSCNCLNVIIESETNDFQQVTTDSFNLTEEEKEDVFFKQGIKQVHKLSRVSKEHPGLVVSRNIGKWIIHQCLNCEAHTHAIHRDRGAACVLVSSKLLSSPEIDTLRASDLISNIFNILVATDKHYNGEEIQLENLPTNIQFALSGLKQGAMEKVNREVAETEERVRLFTEQQYETLEKFREKALREHRTLSSIILEKRYEPLRLSTLYATMGSPPSSRLPIDNVLVLTTNTNLPRPQPRNAAFMKPLKLKKPKKKRTRDSEGVFYFEEVEGDSFTSSEDEDSESEYVEPAIIESGKGEEVPIVRSKPATVNVAKSLPVTIPVFMSAGRNRDVEDDHDDVLPDTDVDEHPPDIAASIKALAKSVHGDTVFGDLPRPRFSTQI